MENALWLARAEIDVNQFLGIKLSVIANPNMYCTIPLYDGFHEWLVEIKYDSLKSVQSEIHEETVSDWALLFIG